MAAVIMTVSDFKHGRSGYQKHHCRCVVCREATKEYKKKYWALNQEKLSEQQKKIRLSRLEEFRAQGRARYAANPRIYEKIKERLARHSEKYKEARKSYREKNRDRIREYCHRVYTSDPEKFYLRSKSWKSRNKERANKRDRLYTRKRRKEDFVFRFSQNLRRRISKAVRGELKSRHTIELIGCSIDQIRLHLEKQFKPGMNWENYGKYGWHVDHIRPCSSFNLVDPKQQMICFNWTNLQPLWATENLRKSNKIA